MHDTGRGRRVVVLEPDPVARVRVARGISAATNFGDVEALEDILGIEQAVGPATRLLVLPDSEIDLGIQYSGFLERLRLGCVARTTNASLVKTLQTQPGLNHLIGWPEFFSIPRLWDLAMCLPREPSDLPSLHDIVPQTAGEVMWRPKTSADRDAVVERVAEIVDTHLADTRLASAVSEVTYEMLMNAMYDAPISRNGAGKYREDRRQDVVLENHEMPTFRFASDGALVVLEVTDPFGGLQRDQVLDSLVRGLGAGESVSDQDVLNTDFGGAGLGMFRMFQQSTCLICAVEPGELTRVIAVFDLDLRVRDRRTFPTSLHLFLNSAEESWTT